LIVNISNISFLRQADSWPAHIGIICHYMFGSRANASIPMHCLAPP
jgi:hypothetical protein